MQPAITPRKEGEDDITKHFREISSGDRRLIKLVKNHVDSQI